jgi:glucan phosphoethanolaminetransferase (alkaline phosphatase superfamily)
MDISASLTGFALAISLVAALIRCCVTKDWSKQAIFFSSSNFASIIVLVVLGAAIWLDPELAKEVIESSKLVLSYAIIYALWDNCSDFFSNKGKGGMGAN